jgi:hypothetical protein
MVAMTDSLSIIALASQAVALVSDTAEALQNLSNRFKVNTVNDSGEFGFRELELQLAANVAKILSWQNLWTLETDKTEDFFLALWGQSGRKHIEKVLCSISSECVSIRESVTILVDLADALLKKHNVKRPSSWRTLPKFLRLSMKTQFDKAEDKQVRDKIEALSKYIDELYTSSELYFRSLHGTPHGVRQDRGQGPTNDLVNQALESRDVSTALYSHCQERGIEVHLDINLLNHDREVDKFPDLFDWADLRLSYRFLFNPGPSLSSAREVVLEPCSPDELTKWPDQNTEHDVESSFELAVIETGSDIMFRLPKSVNAPEAHFYATSKVIASWYDIEPEMLSFITDSRLTPRANELSGRVSLLEKVSLAYRIVECGLFLLGTPWLSHLSSNTIGRLKTSKSEYQYSLHVQSTAELAHTPESPEELERAQIFQIGILLIEIALESTLAVEGYMDIEAASRSISLVEKTMGVRYKQACEFCLNDENDGTYLNTMESPTSQDDTDAKIDSDSMLTRYYSEVFIRYVPQIDLVSELI